MAVSGEPKRGYDDDEDPRRAVLWPGFGIVGAKEMIEEGEDKELDVGERTHSRLRAETDQSSL